MAQLVFDLEVREGIVVVLDEGSVGGGQDDTYLTAVVIASNDESKKLKCGDY